MTTYASKMVLTGLAVAGLGLASPALATTIDYDVTNATSGSCAHGLWTNTSNSGCERYYSFQDGSLFSQDTDTGTATFVATAINSAGHVASLNLSFSGFQDALTSGQEFKAGGGSYNPGTMDFYSNATGTITIDGRVFTLNPSDALAGTTTVQIGAGANDKTGDFGGSAWFNILDPSGWHLPHWDINFDLTRRPGTPVPAPGGMALFGLALVGLWASRRRKPVLA